MVRAVLDGRKTQTRRVIKPQPSHFMNCLDGEPQPMSQPNEFYCNMSGFDSDPGSYIKCPYGVPGDRLYVKEDCYLWRMQSGELVAPDGGDGPDAPVYMDDPEIEKIENNRKHLEYNYELFGWKKVTAQQSPRWASRITLEIVSVRVERIQKISKKDAMAEGVVQIGKSFLMDPEILNTPVKYSNETKLCGPEYWGNDNAPGAFATYIDKISGPETWENNYWVWVIKFKVATKKGVLKTC